MRKSTKTWLLVAIAIAMQAVTPAASRADDEKDRWNIFKKKEKKTDAPLVQAPRKTGDKEIWTIECRVCTGRDHAAEAESYAKSLRIVRQLKPASVAILKEKDRSRVIYGQYELKYVRGTNGEIVVEQNQQIKSDLNLIKHLASGEVHPFLTARAMPVPTEDVGPPEWDLRTAKGAYTLHVGVTYPTPELGDYKGAAVEWVRMLRQDGYEAYYYHDPDSQKSDICVGTFGADALVKERDGTHHYSDAVMRLQSKGDLRFNLENGHKVWRTTTATRDKTGRIESSGGKSANQSFLVKIPGREAPVAQPVRGRP